MEVRFLVTVDEFEVVTRAEWFVMGSTEVEDSYQGARLEDDNITLEFVQKMMDDFKQQRSIHTRYLGAFLML